MARDSGRSSSGGATHAVIFDRKVLADIAMHEREAFNGIIAQAKGALEKKAA